MTDQIKEILQKQLQLLSERSGKCSDEDLSKITYAMVDIAKALESNPF